MQRIALAFAAAYIPLWALVVARHAPSAAAETAPALSPRQGKRPKSSSAAARCTSRFPAEPMVRR